MGPDVFANSTGPVADSSCDGRERHRQCALHSIVRLLHSLDCRLVGPSYIVVFFVSIK
jgi:hypothetical protein